MGAFPPNLSNCAPFHNINLHNVRMHQRARDTYSHFRAQPHGRSRKFDDNFAAHGPIHANRARFDIVSSARAQLAVRSASAVPLFPPHRLPAQDTACPLYASLAHSHATIGRGSPIRGGPRSPASIRGARRISFSLCDRVLRSRNSCYLRLRLSAWARACLSACAGARAHGTISRRKR